MGLAFAPYYLNDFAFIRLAADAPAWTVYAADYLSRIAGLGILLMVPELARVARPPDPGPLVWAWIAPPVLALLLLNDAVDYFIARPLDALLPEAVLFRYPRLGPGSLYYLDVTVGLLLVSISEELLARRVAARLLAELGWRPAAIVVVPALAFGLMHWSMGLGQVVTTALIGMALMAIYLYWRSLTLAVIAHYVLVLWIFI